MVDGPEEESLESKRLTAILEKIIVLLDAMENMPLYRGKLSPKQVAEGMNAASRNAVRLLEDAEVLFDAKRFPTAASLAILAIEEAGKLAVLRALAVAQNEDES